MAEVTIPDILEITDAVKARGADQRAFQTRNVIERLFACAIARGETRFNPAAAIEARFIATARSRDVALKQPIAHSTLNQAIRSLDLGVRDFVIHDTAEARALLIGRRYQKICGKSALSV